LSAPFALDHQAALEQLGRALAAVLASAAERTAAANHAASSRPLRAGDQLEQHNSRVSACQQDDAAVEEVNHRDQLTKIDN